MILFSAYVIMINVDTDVFKHIITALFNCLIYHSASARVIFVSAHTPNINIPVNLLLYSLCLCKCFVFFFLKHKMFYYDSVNK